MIVLYSQEELELYVKENARYFATSELLVDKFLEGAEEYDVDIVSDAKSVYIAGLLRHIEHAGVHSGDSACVFEPQVLKNELAHKMYATSKLIAKKLSIKGLLNIQFATVENKLYVLEVNPRSSRTVPFLAKTSGVDIIDLAVAVWTGEELAQQQAFKQVVLDGYEDIAVGYSIEGYAVKEAVFSFDRFDNIDPSLGPEMRSTGEAIGLGTSVGEAFAKASVVASTYLPRMGTVCMSIAGKYKHSVLEHARRFIALGFDIVATPGTARVFFENDILCKVIARLSDAKRNEITIPDEIKNGNLDLIINIKKSLEINASLDDTDIRNVALHYRIPYVTSIPALNAALDGIEFLKENKVEARKLQYNPSSPMIRAL